MSTNTIIPETHKSSKKSLSLKTLPKKPVSDKILPRKATSEKTLPKKLISKKISIKNADKNDLNIKNDLNVSVNNVSELNTKENESNVNTNDSINKKFCCWVDKDWHSNSEIPIACNKNNQHVEGIECVKCGIWVCEYHNNNSTNFCMLYCWKCGDLLK